MGCWPSVRRTAGAFFTIAQAVLHHLPQADSLSCPTGILHHGGSRSFSQIPRAQRAESEVIKLRDYFQQKLTAELKRQDASANTFHLVNKPTADSYTVEIALLSASPTRIMNNAAAAAAGVVIRGGSFLVSRAKDKGTLSMGIRFYDPSGKLVAETADFEYGKESIPGMILVDSKDFRPYVYHQRIIDEWVKEISTIFITVHEHRIKRPWFSFNPF